MTTYYLQLLAFSGNSEKRTLPHGPLAYIAVRHPSEVKCHDKAGKKEIGYPVISPDLVTVDEFRRHVRLLIKELETIGKEAEKFFAKDVEKRASNIDNKP
jgi:hypothetical protein